MDNSNITELSALQRFICNIVAGIAILFCGAFLFLAGLNILSFNVEDIALPSVLFTFGITFVLTAIIQKNSVSLWISFFFNLPAIIVLIVEYSQLTYMNLYPFFVSIPAIASLFTLAISKEYRLHGFTIAFFGILTALFCLQSFGIVGWKIVGPCFIIFMGVIVLILAFLGQKNKK